jgi:hypothetical protein
MDALDADYTSNTTSAGLLRGVVRRAIREQLASQGRTRAVHNLKRNISQLSRN